MNVEEGLEKMREAYDRMGSWDYDEENLHRDIDSIIVQFLPPEIKKEYDRIRKEYHFWFE